MRCLVVYYSRTGNTRGVAVEIARRLSADLEQLTEPRDRRGVWGFLRSAFEARLGRTTTLRPIAKDPAAYDLVVVGTPVWSESVSCPVRTYLEHNRPRLPRVAFFLTHGGRGRQRVFGQMRDLAGRAPIAALALRERELGSLGADRLIDDFIVGVGSALRRPEPQPEPQPQPQPRRKVEASAS
jgi:flavodoxin